jgi:hypothetical protein
MVMTASGCGPGRPARRLVILGVLALLGLLSSPERGLAEDLSRFFGSYVGSATVEDVKTGAEQQRDIDIVVSPYRRAGLQITWITVGLVDGRRDVPGVKRWSQTALFQPADDQRFMVEVGEGSLFKERDDMEVIKGDPVRWTRVEDDTLHAFSFVVLDDGRYELQVYQRILTEIGMDILFERIVDGEVIRRVTGRTARAS